MIFSCFNNSLSYYAALSRKKASKRQRKQIVRPIGGYWFSGIASYT
jgi:hypothetical protein